MYLRVLFFLFYFLSLFPLKSQDAGDIDNTFSVGTAFNNFAYDVILQSDGKVLVAGSFTNYNGTTRERVIRLNSDGSVDTGFNTSSAFDNAAWCLAVDDDGKVIVGGTFTNYNTTTRGRIARLNTNGSLDNTFAPPGTGFNDVVYAIAIQSDGKIIAVGDFTSFNGTSRRKIARLNTDGTLDTSFNPGDGFNGRCEAVAIQSDGKIVVGGDFTSFDGVGRRRIARLNTNGTIDTGFVPSGTAFNDFVYDLIILSDGKILVAGAFTNYNSTTRNRLAKLNSDGTLDTGFAPAGTGFNNDVWGIKLQSDGKIIAVGNFTSFNGNSRNRIVRLNSDGTLDNTFNIGDGLTSAKAHDLVIQSDGKIIVVGEFTQYQSTSRSRITRIWGDNTPLPVNLVYFQATSQKKGILLQWKTAKEINSSHFEVEHAQDGKTWKKIAVLRGNGSTSMAQLYSFLHESPLNGTNYYRLKQVDNDGSFNYSQAIAAEWQEVFSETVLYPNPSFDGRVYFALDTTEPLHFQLLNQNGQVLENGFVHETLQFSNLANGIYYFQIHQQGRSMLFKWLLQK